MVSRITANPVVTLLFMTLLLAVGVGTVAAEEYRHWGVAPIPIVGYTPDDGGILGLSTFIFYGPDVGVPEEERSGARTNLLDANLLYTTEGSYGVSLGASNFLGADRYRFDVGLGASSAPGVYYGDGPRSTLDDPDGYEVTGFSASVGFSIEIMPDFYLGPLVEIQQAGIVVDDEATAIRDNDIELYGAGLRMIRDTTGGVFWPDHGSIIDTSARQYSAGCGLYTLDARAYRRLWRAHILAGQLAYTQAWGDIDWSTQPSIGGDGLFRGMPSRRFTDDVAVSSQLEYRVQVVPWLGAVAFASVGQVGDTLIDLDWSRPAVAGGGGLRITLSRSEHLNLRIDIAVSPEGGGPYIAAGEAF